MFDALRSEPLLVYRVTIILCGLAALVGTIELLTIRREFAHGGLWAWSIQREGFRPRGGKPLLKILNVVFSETGFQVLLVFRLLAITLLLFVAPGAATFLPVLSAVVLTQLFLNYRIRLGSDGSDQMVSIILVASWLVFAASTVSGETGTELLDLGLYFIATQSALSYLASGLVKVVSPVWRGGEAIYRILDNSAYGSPSMVRLLKSNRPLQVTLCWSTILFETTFVLFFFIPSPYNYFYLALGGLFHVVIAASMGLNLFLTAFLAAYPALTYADFQFKSWLGS